MLDMNRQVLTPAKYYLQLFYILQAQAKRESSLVLGSFPKIYLLLNSSSLYLLQQNVYTF